MEFLTQIPYFYMLSSGRREDSSSIRRDIDVLNDYIRSTEKQIDIQKPLIHLVDNMVKMSSLHGNVGGNRVSLLLFFLNSDMSRAFILVDVKALTYSEFFSHHSDTTLSLQIVISMFNIVIRVASLVCLIYTRILTWLDMI